VILTSGSASVPLARAAWRRGDVRVPLGVAHSAFSGLLTPRGSGAWLLDLATADGAPLEGDAPELRLTVVPDSAPVVAVPVPGRDTTLPLSLRQPLVIDARDDHGLTRLEVVSWRVSQTGKVGEAVGAPPPWPRGARGTGRRRAPARRASGGGHSPSRRPSGRRPSRGNRRHCRRACRSCREPWSGSPGRRRRRESRTRRFRRGCA